MNNKNLYIGSEKTVPPTNSDTNSSYLNSSNSQFQYTKSITEPVSVGLSKVTDNTESTNSTQSSYDSLNIVKVRKYRLYKEGQ